MKPIAIFVLVAAFSVAAIATSAKNVTAPGNTDERMGIAAPKAAAETSQRRVAARVASEGKHLGKLQQAKFKPPLQDPN